MREPDGVAAPILIVVTALLVLVVGGIGVDLGRVVAEQQRLVGLSEGAALAGATAVDVESLYQGDPEPVLDPVAAYQRACNYLMTHAAMSCNQPDASITVTQATIEVALQTDVELTLLRLVQPTPPQPIAVTATSTATALRSN